MSEGGRVRGGGGLLSHLSFVINQIPTAIRSVSLVTDLHYCDGSLAYHTPALSTASLTSFTKQGHTSPSPSAFSMKFAGVSANAEFWLRFGV
jgi:hypothetical protein